MPKPRKKGKVDLELIGVAIRKAQKDLLKIRKLKSTGPKTKKTIDKKVKRLDKLFTAANAECCDQQWYCPPNEDGPSYS